MIQVIKRCLTSLYYFVRDEYPPTQARPWAQGDPRHPDELRRRDVERRAQEAGVQK